MNLHTNFILASQSPRRRKLLRQIGLPFIHIPSNIDETINKRHNPTQVVENLAIEKAHLHATRRPDALILGADTIVVADGRILGKPSGVSDAKLMLRRLSESIHQVHTGIALIHKTSNRIVTSVETTEVTFGKLTDNEITNYVKTGSPLDKAGAYGIQDDMGALFVERINGDYYNVVGLPLRRLYVLLRKHFTDLITF